MKKFFELTPVLCILLAVPQITKAQIGYQVSLLNTATGEPQANKTVNVNIAITNAENEVVHTEIQTATTNDFGILSLSVGNEDTFKNADWNKLPFYISVSVDGTLIGKSQILTVPVAEYAKTAGPMLTKEMLVGTWSFRYSYAYTETDGQLTVHENNHTFTFNQDNTCIYVSPYETIHLTYSITSDHIYLYAPLEDIVYTNEGKLISSTIDYGVYMTLIFIPEEYKLMEMGLDSHMLFIKN